MVLRDLVNHPAVYSFCKRAITPLSKFAASAPFMPRAASRTIARWSLLNIWSATFCADSRHVFLDCARSPRSNTGSAQYWRCGCSAPLQPPTGRELNVSIARNGRSKVSKTAHSPPVYFLRNSLSAPRQGRKSRWRTKRRGALAVTPLSRSPCVARRSR